MKEYNENRINHAENEHVDELYSIPNEGNCSAEFPEGCILSE